MPRVPPALSQAVRSAAKVDRPYRSRAGVVVAAAGAGGLCAVVGATVGHLFGPDIAVTALISFFAALLVALGPAGSVVGIQAVVGLVVFSQFDFPPGVAAREGGLVLLGGAVQAALVVLLWPLRRFPAERRALGDAYGALSRFAVAASSSSDTGVLLEPGAMDGLETVWRDSQPFGGDEIAAHRALAAQADRLRLELVAVLRARSRLADNSEADAATALAQVLARAGTVLGEVAAAIRDGRAPTGWEGERLGFRYGRDALARAAEPGPGAWASATAIDAEARVDALAGELRAVLRTAAVPAGVPIKTMDEVMEGETVATASTRSGAEWAAERLATLRSNLTLSSQACRHAMRMSATMAVAVAVAHAFPFAHHYWLPMTAMLVLRCWPITPCTACASPRWR